MSDMRNFFLQMETSLGSGIPIVRAMQLIAENLPAWGLRSKVSRMAQLIDRGATFSGAMTQIGSPFSQLHISFIRFGEEAGCLDKVCAALAQHSDKEVMLQREIVNAMLYPGFVLGVALVMMPVINAIQSGQTWTAGVPGAVMALVIYAAVIIGGMLLWKTSVGGVLDSIFVHIPFIGGVMRQMALARFTRTLAVGLSAGVPLIQALETSISVSDNPWLQTQMQHLPKHVGSGKGLSAGLADVGCLPSTLREMISVGEQSGRLSEMLEKTATFFEQEASNRISMLMKVLPAILFLLVAIYVGFQIVGYWQTTFTNLSR